MKIPGPKGPASPTSDDAGVSKSSATRGGGKAFDVGGPRGPGKPNAAEAARKAEDPFTADLTAELKLGKLGPQEAVEKVVERVLSRQLGTDSPAAVREKVRAALRDALDADPLLAEKLKGLTR